MRYTDRKVPAALEGGENTKDDAEEDGEDAMEERHLDITLHQHQQTSLALVTKQFNRQTQNHRIQIQHFRLNSEYRFGSRVLMTKNFMKFKVENFFYIF
jgi:hypothetical protein